MGSQLTGIPKFQRIKQNQKVQVTFTNPTRISSTVNIDIQEVQKIEQGTFIK